MPVKQVGRGLTKEQREQNKKQKQRRTTRKRSLKKLSNQRKKKILEEGFQLKDRIFLDAGNSAILKKLDLNKDYNVSKYFIDAHGSLMRDHFTVPHNIVLLYLGVMGNITLMWALERMNDICNGTVIPNNILVPGEKAPNVSLSGERYDENVSGIFKCGSVIKRILNDVLVPTQEVIDSYKNSEEFEIMKDPETGMYPIPSSRNYSITLARAVHKISNTLDKNTYAFVFLSSCLGGACSMPLTQQEFKSIVNPEKFDILRTGDTLYNPEPDRLQTIAASFDYEGDTEPYKMYVFENKMSHAKDKHHWYYRNLLKSYIEKYDIKMFIFSVYDKINKYYEYDINDFIYFQKYANFLQARIKPVRNYNHFIYFMDTHRKILKALKNQKKDKFLALTRRENALRYSINPIKYSDLAANYGMSDIILEDIYPFQENYEKVEKNIKNINNFAKKWSKAKTLPAIFLKDLWKQYIENPLLRSNDDTLFSGFWFDDHEKMKNLKNKTRLIPKQAVKLQNLQRAYDYYTITNFMLDIIQTIDLYKEKSEGRIDYFKTQDLPSYNMEYVQQIMKIAMDYVISEDYKNREIAHKDKIIKQLEDMNTMIQNYIKQHHGGSVDFLTALFKFFGF
jgi:hypothetical protein